MKAKSPQNLTLADLHHLNAAEGWLGLGDVVSASDELEAITPELRGHPAVLAVRYDVYAKGAKWDMAAEVADALVRMMPEQSASWICLAYSTRRRTGGSIPEAKEVLLRAAEKFPNEFLIRFNLACYCSQLRQFDEAQAWLKKAMALDEKSVQKLAIDDPDLHPLWDSLGGTLWKRE